MAFVAPFLTAAVGLTGTAALVGEAVIGAGLSLGLGYAARRLQPQPDNRAQGMRLNLRLQPGETRDILVGRMAVAGSLEYHNSYGPNGNDYVQMVFALVDHECDGLDGMYVYGKPVTLGAHVSTAEVSGYTVAEYPGCMWVEFHNGAWNQAADADCVAHATGGTYAATRRGRGVCYVRVTIKFDPEKYKAGQPNFLFVVRGAKLYDIRKDSTAGGSGSHRWGDTSTYEWTRNPGVIGYNYLRGIYVGGVLLGGANAPPASVPAAEWIAFANDCAETVALAGGGSEPRYCCDGVIPVRSQHLSVLREIISTTGGYLIESGGICKPYAGVARASVLAITDNDIMAADPVEITTKKSRAQLVNAAFGSFTDPAQLYEEMPLPARVSPADEAADGGIHLPERYALGYVHSATQGQRVLEILRRKARLQRRATLRLNSRCCLIEAGDWITWTSARYGYTNSVWEVETATLDRDLSVRVVLTETSASVYGWSTADELDPLAPAPVGPGGERFSTVTGIDLDAIIVTGAGDEQRPGLLITWTPVTDKTVIRLALEYRKVGDTVALERTILEPSNGSYKWLDGVQGGITYEARLRPVTMPERSTTWSSWYSSASQSAPQVVSVAAYAENINPANLPPAYLASAQEQFEIRLITALGTVQGSLAERDARLLDEIDRLAHAHLEHRASHQDTRARVIVTQETLQTDVEALASYKIEVDAALDSIDGTILGQSTAITNLTSRVTSAEGTIAAQGTALTAVQSELPNKASASSVNALTTRVTSAEGTISAQATAVTNLQTTVGGHTNSISQITALDGGNKRYTMVFGSDGKFFKVIEINGTAELLEMIFGSTSFKIFDPLVANGAAKPFFSAQAINGVNKFVLDGDVWARHLLVDTLTSITASFGDATVTGILSGGPTGKLKLDFTNGRIRATT